MQYKNSWAEKELSKHLFAELTRLDIQAVELPLKEAAGIDFHWAYRSSIDLGNIL